MRPIPDDAPPAVGSLAQALRDLVDASGIPAASLSARTGLGRSTVYHALSGERVPTVNTVLTIVKTCQEALPEGLRSPVTESAARPEDWWALKVELAHRSREYQRISPEAQAGSPAPASAEIRPPRSIAGRSAVGGNAMYVESAHTAMTEDDTDVSVEEQVSVAAAAAALDRALANLEQATRDVTHARALLARATAASRPTQQTTGHDAAGAQARAREIFLREGIGKKAKALAQQLALLPVAEQEEKLTHLVRHHAAAVLDRADTEPLGGSDDLLEAGFDSLSLVELWHRISVATGVELPVAFSVKHRTPSSIAAYVREVLAVWALH